ncbi:MAG: iron-sulfur cluster assembly scaffold protein [Sphingomicrobium sp.]
MSEALYTRDILRLAASVPHLGPLAEPDGCAERRSPACGSRMTVAVRIADGRVTALGQTVEACAFGQASAALMGDHAIGREREDVADALTALTAWLSGEAENPGPWPGLAILAPARPKTGRHGAILLPFRTFLAAIDDACGG